MISIQEGLVAVKTDDIAGLKQHIRHCIAAASNIVDDTHQLTTSTRDDVERERQRRLVTYLSMHDGSRQRTTLLHWASYLGGLMAVKLLAHHGADVNATEADGKTALHWAAFEGHKKIVEYLLFDREAKYDLVDLLDNTPCHLALLNEHMEVARLFPNYRVVVAGELAADKNSISPQRSPRRTALSEGLTSMTPGRSLLRQTSPPQAAARSISVPFGKLDPPSDFSESVGPTPAPSLSVRPISRSGSTERNRPRTVEEKEARRVRKEAKQQRLRDELFAKLVMEAPTPVKHLQFQSTQQNHVVQSEEIVTREYHQRDQQADANHRVWFHRQQSEEQTFGAGSRSTTPRMFSVATERYRLPDNPMYSRSSTPPGSRRSSTPGRARPEWRPPSRTFLHRTEDRDSTIEAIQQPYQPAPRLSISRMNVRSY
ncbi:ankyrin repeat protein, putative [Bodo saltans]|uniref:Ankyrin repeat protein, putative n=1 Tax=Bodo saltans TaxID=75058 RepID=A0A0S4JGD4_BODSA|nr:ankyrin repeat protein, putative [Bodo saltans]|eukprot:CUG89074.1 ankyrin repeat protein, putative [Bodo saltans]